ncbi:MAG: glycosyltransferase [Candidatus Omnitrophota bacterium]|nr:glycosyltransferase [Candidatus Omnitrophota bacterium]
MRKRVLLMYITARSGHYQAARALEQAIRRVNPAVETLRIDAFQYLNPVLARIVDRMYLSVIQNAPEIWDYLYDNPKVVHRSDSFRKLLHRYDSPRLHGLLEDFRPDAIACTQAFPCGLVADFKEEQDLSTPLYGILTDFSPHAYWVHAQVNGYVVPAEESRQWLLDRRVEPDRVQALGIPIDPVFSESPDVQAIRRRLQITPGVPVILLMGGGQGLGPIVETVEQLNRIPLEFQLLVIAGTNESLYHKLITRAPALKHPMQVFGHVDFIADLMSVASFIITKPGGLTTAEALAKGLPILALEPIPGQEAKNASFLVREKAAHLVTDFGQLAHSAQYLLEHPAELAEMAASARRLGKPQAALNAARLVVGA